MCLIEQFKKTEELEDECRQFVGKMRYFALRSNFITPLPLLLLPPARLTIASHNIFLRTLKRG